MFFLKKNNHQVLKWLVINLPSINKSINQLMIFSSSVLKTFGIKMIKPTYFMSTDFMSSFMLYQTNHSQHQKVKEHQRRYHCRKNDFILVRRPKCQRETYCCPIKILCQVFFNTGINFQTLLLLCRAGQYGQKCYHDMFFYINQCQ